MRTLVPAETLVYLETNDLAAALQPIVDAKPFMEVAKSKPDFSALKGVQLAVAVTGFETSEEKLTDEHSVGRVQPRFVAVAETHAWNYQALKFAELKLGSFVANIYDSEPTLEKSDKNGGKYFTWTATDGRKAFALVIDSIIYFGNDESAIEKCLAVNRGETDSILKTGKIPVTDPTTLAQGYVSTDGIAQIAGLVGLKFASEAGEESEVQSAIAGILPQLIRNSITEISWTSTKTEKGIEDKYAIGMPADAANVFNETMASEASPDLSWLQSLPGPVLPVTVYNFKNPRAAWRSVVLKAQGTTNPLAGKILSELSNVPFDPYGINDAERFLSVVNSVVVTGKCDEAGENPFVAAMTSDWAVTKSSLDPRFQLRQKWTDLQGGEMWATKDNDLAAYTSGGFVAIGSFECVETIANGNHWSPDQMLKNNLAERIRELHATATTFGSDKELAQPVAELLSELRPDVTPTKWSYSTETRFTKTGIDRRTTSDFGLIGSIIAQLGGDE